MILLVIDTSGRNGAVALARAAESDPQPEILQVAPLVGGTFSAQLVPEIAALLGHHSLGKSDVGGFVVVSGPGSFTGLRVGLSAIKALAEILEKPIAAVSLLELIAAVSGKRGSVVAVLDGGRREVFFGKYEIGDTATEIVREELLSQAEFLVQAQGAVIVTPDATLAGMARDAQLPVFPVDVPDAAMIACFGWKKLLAGETTSPEKLEANYMRRSDAELFVKAGS